MIGDREGTGHGSVHDGISGNVFIFTVENLARRSAHHEAVLVEGFVTVTSDELTPKAGAPCTLGRAVEQSQRATMVRAHPQAIVIGTRERLIDGTRQALVDGFQHFAILGIDLVGHFSTHEPGLSCLRLVEGSVSTWNPDRPFDLITCVHGLHYVGDKLGLVSRAAAWLVEDGRCVAHLDVGNLRSSKGAGSGRAILAALRGQGLEYDRRRRLLKCQGRKALELPFRYLGADDQVGPNYTGQPAVASHYEAAPRSGV